MKGKIAGTRKRDRLVETVGSGLIPASVSRTGSTVLLLAKTAQEGLPRRGAMTRIQVEGRLTQNHTDALCVACTEQQAKWLAYMTEEL